MYSFRYKLRKFYRKTLRRGIKRHHVALVVALIVIGVGAFSGMKFLNTVPESFPVEGEIEVAQGASLRDIAVTLKDAGAIRSTFLFKLVALLTGASEELRAGTYIFPDKLSTYGLVRALATGLHGDHSIAFTVFEGMNIEDIDEAASKTLPLVKPGEFREAAQGLEGELFPDTYHIPETYSAVDLANFLHLTFEERMKEVREDIEKSGKTEEEILIMASILEREGNSAENMAIISGILWKRIDMGMPLQVDATLDYYLDKSSAELTRADLESESAFNTYLNKGLPPTPISNPGMRAIRAALYPTETPYLYFLTGNDGNFYYASTFEGHKQNKLTYLR